MDSIRNVPCHLELAEKLKMSQNLTSVCVSFFIYAFNFYNEREQVK